MPSDALSAFQMLLTPGEHVQLSAQELHLGKGSVHCAQGQGQENALPSVTVSV